MKNRRKRYEKAVTAAGTAVFLLLAVLCSAGEDGHSMKDMETVQASSSKPDQIYACGFPVGIYLDTSGVLVVDHGDISDSDGKSRSPSRHLLLPGDYIVSVNDVSLQNKKHLMKLLNESMGNVMKMEIRRGQETEYVDITPVEDEKGRYKLGVWVRDNVQGIGTMTYVDENGNFGALGHGINDVDLGQELEISRGRLYCASVLAVNKGIAGEPGELKGAIDYDDRFLMGSISKNSSCGITGKLLDGWQEHISRTPCQMGKREDIHRGDAVILCDLGEGIQKFQILITDIDENPTDVNKSFRIQVKDERLLSATGGIIRGMSGSPILQDGRLVGAVTHVMVNDPASGYGIFIENMTSAAK